MYKSIILTGVMLEELGALDGTIGTFNYYFPKGLKISNDQDEMNDLFADIYFDDDIAFDVAYLLDFHCHRTTGNDYISSCDRKQLHKQISVFDAAAFLSDIHLLK
jgi:hypothetical protein